MFLWIPDFLTFDVIIGIATDVTLMLKTGNLFQALLSFYKNYSKARSGYFNSWHLPFLIVPYSPFQKHETLEFWHKSLVSSWSRLLNWKKTWNLASVLQIVQKIPENYCPCFYLSIGQVWLFHELWLKRYVQKCALSRVLISSWRHRFGQSWDVQKYTNLHILRTEHKFSMK